MARPLKNGLDYFPLDVDFLHDRKVRRIVRQNGSAGIAAIVALFCEIYRGKGYYVAWDEDLCFDICDQTECTADEVKNILRGCLEVRLFDPDLYALHTILTSSALQRRYIKINQDCKRKRTIDPIYSLIADDEPQAEGIDLPKSEMEEVSSEVTVVKAEVYSDKTPQNKQEETKVQQSKTDQNRPQQSAPRPIGKGGEGAVSPVVQSPSLVQSIDNQENIAVKPILKLNLDAINVTNVKTVEAISALSQRPEIGGPGGVLWKVLGAQYRPLLVRKDNPGDYILWVLNNPKLFEETYNNYLHKKLRG